MPSDTIYGLSCRALDERAVERVHKLKKRDPGKPLIVLISDIAQLNDLGINPNQAEPIKNYWPGKISMEFSAPESPAWLHRGTKKFAIRMPANKELDELIKKTGPIISTSANVQSGKLASSLAEAKRCFGDRLDFYIDAGTIRSKPSTIVVVKNGKLAVDRQGAVKIGDTARDSA